MAVLTSLQRQMLDISLIELSYGAWRDLSSDLSADFSKLLPVVQQLLPSQFSTPAYSSLISNLKAPTDLYPFKIVTLQYLLDIKKYELVNMAFGGNILFKVSDIQSEAGSPVYYDGRIRDGGYCFVSKFDSKSDPYLPVGDIFIPYWGAPTGSIGPMSFEFMSHIPVLLVKNTMEYSMPYNSGSMQTVGSFIHVTRDTTSRVADHVAKSCLSDFWDVKDADCVPQGDIKYEPNLTDASGNTYICLGWSLWQTGQVGDYALVAEKYLTQTINNAALSYDNVLLGDADILCSSTPFFTFYGYGTDNTQNHDPWSSPNYLGIHYDIFPINAMRACCSNVDTLGLPICGDRYFTDFPNGYAPTTECSTIMDTYCTEDKLMTDQCNSYCSHSPNNVCDIPLSSFCDKACYPDTNSTEYASGNCAVNKFTKNPNFVKTCGCAFQQDFYDNWRDSLIKAINPDLAKFFEGIGSIVPQCDYPDCAGGTALKLRSQETEGCPNKDVEVCLSQTNVNIGEAVNSKININTLENCIESKYTSGNPGNPKLPSFPDGNQTSKIIVIVVVVAIILLIVIALIYFFV